jgi:hypothetical protein
VPPRRLPEPRRQVEPAAYPPQNLCGFGILVSFAASMATPAITNAKAMKAIATMCGYVRFWHKADVPTRSTNVRFWGKADMTPTIKMRLGNKFRLVYCRS